MSKNYAEATHTVMKLLGENNTIEDAVWTAVWQHELGLCQYGRLITETRQRYTEKEYSDAD